MTWPTINALIAMSLGIGLWLFLLVCVLALFRFASSTKKEDMALDDMEQVAAVSKPAPLVKHVRANTAYGEPLQ